MKIFKPLVTILTIMIVMFFSNQILLSKAYACTAAPNDIDPTSILPNSSSSTNGIVCPTTAHPIATQVSWTAPTGGANAATSYAVRIRDHTLDPWTGTNCSSSGTTGNICTTTTNTSYPYTFQLNHTYSIWLNAINACGWSDNINPDPAASWYAASCIPDSPTLSSYSCSNTTGQISFTTGENTTETLVYYCNQTTEATTNQCETWTAQPNGYEMTSASPLETSPTTITGLTLGDTYSFFVRACNGDHTLSETICTDSNTQRNPATFNCQSPSAICTVDWSQFPSISANQTYNIPVTVTSNFDFNNPVAYLDTNVITSLSNQAENNDGTDTFNIQLTTSTAGSHVIQFFLDDSNSQGILCGSKTFLASAPTSAMQLSFILGLDGIGSTGTHRDPIIAPNNVLAPTVTSFPITVTVTNSSHTYTEQGTIDYINDPAAANNTFGKFKTTVPIDLGSSFASGNYNIQLSIPRYKTITLPDIETINSTPILHTINQTVNMITGDVNDDGEIDVADYAKLLGCDGQKITPITTGECEYADIDDSGTVDVSNFGYDYNLFLSEYASQIID